jgi:tRNA modification GTPase
MEALADADVVLVVLDVSHYDDNARATDAELLARTEGRRRLAVFNKIDLVGGAATIERYKAQLPLDSAGVALTSATTGEGIDTLRARIVEFAGGAAQESGFLTNARHHSLVRDAIAALDKASAAVRDTMPHEMLLLDLYSALRPLDEITGATTADDILNLIFSSFCIGK